MGVMKQTEKLKEPDLQIRATTKDNFFFKSYPGQQKKDKCKGKKRGTNQARKRKS